MATVREQTGYTLIEMVIVIIILGILAAIAFRYLGGAIDSARTEETKTEMERLAFALAGNPALVSGGNRVDFGYVGDVGALPVAWDDLAVNPGYATWKGPYIRDDFSGSSPDFAFKLDAWGKEYSSPTGHVFSSTGGPTAITRVIADAAADLLYNRIVLYIADVDHSPPGSSFRDSVRLELVCPDGVGGTRVRTAVPETNGLARFDSIPVGIHTLRMIYLPADDTLQRKVTVDPGRIVYLDLQYYADVW
jgi:prepilin-type N-terminal cleavage/methylation domain-containing protein